MVLEISTATGSITWGGPHRRGNGLNESRNGGPTRGFDWCEREGELGSDRE